MELRCELRNFDTQLHKQEQFLKDLIEEGKRCGAIPADYKPKPC